MSRLFFSPAISYTNGPVIKDVAASNVAKPEGRRPKLLLPVVRCVWRFIKINLLPHLWEVSTDNNRFKKTTIGAPGPIHIYFGTWNQLQKHLDRCPMANAVCDIGSCYKNHIGGICMNILDKLGRFCYRSFRRINLFRLANP